MTTPIDVRFLFAANNPRRATEYELIRDSAAQAGFNVIDGNSPTWTVGPREPVAVRRLAVRLADHRRRRGRHRRRTSVTDGQNNPQGYSNADGRRRLRRAAGHRPGRRTQQTELADRDRAAAVVATPSASRSSSSRRSLAWNSTYVTNVSAIPLSPQMFCNFWDWEAVS